MNNKMKSRVFVYNAVSLLALSMVSCGVNENNYVISESDLDDILNRIEVLEGRISDLESSEYVEEEDIEELQDEVEALKEDLEESIIDEDEYGPFHERR